MTFCALGSPISRFAVSEGIDKTEILKAISSHVLAPQARLAVQIDSKYLYFSLSTGGAL